MRDQSSRRNWGMGENKSRLFTWAGNDMHTLDLHQAAAFLHMHPEEVRRRAKLGLLPGAKPGKAWIFIDDDLADYVRSHYANKRQALQVTPRKEQSCHSTNAVARGGS